MYVRSYQYCKLQPFILRFRYSSRSGHSSVPNLSLLGRDERANVPHRWVWWGSSQYKYGVFKSHRTNKSSQGLHHRKPPLGCTLKADSQNINDTHSSSSMSDGLRKIYFQSLYSACSIPTICLTYHLYSKT